MNILLIAGHGDGDSGAIGNGYAEENLTREIAKLLFTKLQALCNVELADTKRDWFKFLGSNSYDFSMYDYVLELHFNSGGGTGTEVYVTSSENGITVEEAILRHICSSVNYQNRGVKRKNFRVISRVKNQGVSSALLEVCFIDNPADIETYQTEKNLIAESIAIGIAEGFGIEFKTTMKQRFANSNSEDQFTQCDDALSWCEKNNILPDGDIKNFSDVKNALCLMIYKAVKLFIKD